MVKRMKLRHRILLGFMIPILIMFAVAGLAYYAERQSSEAYTDVENDFNLIVMVRRISEATLAQGLGLRGYIISSDERALEEMREGRRSFVEAMESIHGMVADNPELLGSWVKIESAVNERLIPQHDSLVAISRRNGDSAHTATLATAAAALDKRVLSSIRTELDRLAKQHEGHLNESRIEGENALASITGIVFTGAGIGAVIAVIIAVMVSRGIVRSINDTVNAVSTSSTQIAATIEEQERTATAQAAAVNETTATMDELGVSSRQSAEQADLISTAARQSLTLADGGAQGVRQTLTAMNDLKEKVGSIADQILRLSEHTGQIGSITNLVSDLANQTNPLALNAAVEAARAGEHGRGFAVVAVEIRKLADQSKKSAERIALLVQDIQKATNATVMATEEGTRTVDEGIRLVNRTGDAFNTSASSIGSTFESVQQITLNMKQQASAIRQVVDAMSSLNTGAKETAAGISQTRTGVITLVEAANNLKAMV